MSEAEKDPLQAEAAKRKDWRGEEPIVPDAAASGHTPPASEGGAGGEGSGRGPAPRRISPPD